MMQSHIFIRDIRRCPYVPKDSEYASWHEKEEERLRELSDERERLRLKAREMLFHNDSDVRKMAMFVDWVLGDK